MILLSWCYVNLGSIPKIPHQIYVSEGITMDFGETLGTIKVLAARRQGVTTEAYEQYAAGRNDRMQRRR